jgi:hypothetical protein
MTVLVRIDSRRMKQSVQNVEYWYGNATERLQFSRHAELRSQDYFEIKPEAAGSRSGTPPLELRPGARPVVLWDSRYACRQKMLQSSYLLELPE